MNPFDSQNTAARKYLEELRSALVDAPRQVRDEMVAEIADELRGLDDNAVRMRIQEIGDPRIIAADATAETSTATVVPAPSRSYAVVTSVVLTAGWYLVPFIGWLAGLIMIAVGDHWTASVRRKSIISSVAVIILSVAGIVAFRGSSLWPLGFSIFAAGPLIGNIFVASYLRHRWGASTVQKTA